MIVWTRRVYRLLHWHNRHGRSTTRVYIRFRNVLSHVCFFVFSRCQLTTHTAKRLVRRQDPCGPRYSLLPRLITVGILVFARTCGGIAMINRTSRYWGAFGSLAVTRSIHAIVDGRGIAVLQCNSVMDAHAFVLSPLLNNGSVLVIVTC